MKFVEANPEQGFRDFDLPVAHLLDQRDHIPAKAHDSAEIERRRELTRGTLVLEEQAKGLNVAKIVLSETTEQEGLIFGAKMIAMAGLNTAWYTYAQSEIGVMRRRLHLPIMSDGRSLIPEYLLEDATALLEKGRQKSIKLAEANEYYLPRYHKDRIDTGRVIGNASLRLAVYESVARGFITEYTGNDIGLQTRARSECVRTLTKARDMHREMGAHPSIAQLADPYSHLSVYWHRHAPQSIARSLGDAIHAS